MNVFRMNTLSRGVKVHPEFTKEEQKTKTFSQMWEEAEARIKANPFKLDTAIFNTIDYEEQYAWIDERLEEMASHVEEDDDEDKNVETFDFWTSEKLLAIDATYEWADDRLEDMASHVEEDDDEDKNAETFSL